jgi:transcriptional regulator with XRE-family HTH domain
MTQRGSSFSPELKRPAFWEKRVIAAYLRLLGATQEATAGAINRSKRTVQYWESDKSAWKLAQEEAAERWLDDLTNAARKTVLEAIRAGDSQLAMAILERRVPELAPPKSRVEVSIDWDRLTDDELRRLASGEPPQRVLVAGQRNGTTPHEA